MKVLPTRTGTVAALRGPRQAQVFRLLAVGKSNKEIAQSLDMSVSTVKSHVSRILLDLSLSNRAEVAAWANRYPDVFAGLAVGTSLHPPGCQCGEEFCRRLREMAADTLDAA